MTQLRWRACLDSLKCERVCHVICDLSQIAYITGPTNAAIAAHLLGLVAPLVGPNIIMMHSLLQH